jgi:DNA-binding CsgD family transcriptional regulator
VHTKVGIRDAFTGFSLAFIGIGLTRFWYQYNLYNLHFSADDGFSTVEANLIRSAVIAIMLILAWNKEFSQKTRSVLVWVSLALMTGASVVAFYEEFTGDQNLGMIRYLLIGLGLVWGAGMWMDFFKRLPLSKAFLYLVCGLALSCLLSLIGGYLPSSVMALFSLFIPTFAVLAYLRAMKVLDEHGVGPSVTDALGRYTKQHRKDIIQIASSMIIYAFIMGMALGFPDGRQRNLSQTARTVHQLIIIVLLLWLTWWVCIRGRAFTFDGMWYLENGLMILSIIIILAEQPWATDLSAFILTNAETLFYTFVFFVCCAIAQHSKRDAMWILGALYGATLLAMSLGRIFNAGMNTLLGSGIPQLVCMSVLVVVEMLMALRPTILKERPLFSNLHPYLLNEANSNPTNSGSDLVASSSSVQATIDTKEEPHSLSFADSTEKRLSELQKQYSLTSTEESIAQLICCGRSRSVIAQELGYSQNTIRNYTRALYQKMGIHNKQQLIDLAEGRDDKQ